MGLDLLELEIYKIQMSHICQYWTLGRLSHNITTPKLMDLGFSIVSDILFITKHKNDHNFGSNLKIDKILSVLYSPGHPRDVKKEQKALSHKVGWLFHSVSVIIWH